MSRPLKSYLRHFLPIMFAVLVAVAPSAHASEVDFTLPDIAGQPHSLSDYRGKWGEELPELEIFHSNASGKAVVVGVNMESISDERLQKFVDEQFLSFPILRADARPAPKQLVGPVAGLPTSYLISPSGKVVARQVGQVTAEAIAAFIDQHENRQPGGK